jgi:dipeptidyl aminopeptidase/acylaminoacyl peptidase
LTQSGAASGIQALPNGRALFSRSSLTSANDVFLISALKHLENEHLPSDERSRRVSIEQITTFTRAALEGKDLAEGEDFWFKGANDKRVQGWALKPKGFKKGERKKWPVVLLIHGGVCVHYTDRYLVIAHSKSAAPRRMGRSMVHSLESKRWDVFHSLSRCLTGGPISVCAAGLLHHSD